MDSKLYKLTAKTNMHVGSGDSDFGVIDNKVQRDILTGYPTIYASSLKGALREHMEINSELNSSLINNIFGGDGVSDMSSGKYKFFNANLLSIPARSNNIQYYNATTVKIIEEFIQCTEDFGIPFSKRENLKSILKELKEKIYRCEAIVISENNSKGIVRIEDVEAQIKKIDSNKEGVLEDIFGGNLVIFNEKEFKEYIDNLPVIARNKLVAGVSKNLWYEEIVPRETMFYMPMFIESYNDGEYNEFTEVLKSPVQIGANASIGQGYTLIKEVE